MQVVFGEEWPLSEEAPAPEVFCSGCATVDLIGPTVAMWTLYRYAPEARKRLVVLRIIAPIESIDECVRLTLAAQREAQRGGDGPAQEPHFAH